MNLIPENYQKLIFHIETHVNEWKTFLNKSTLKNFKITDHIETYSKNIDFPLNDNLKPLSMLLLLKFLRSYNYF